MDERKNTHKVDMLFALTLFFLFALSMGALVALSASAYRSSVETSTNNFNDRTLCLYITEKVREYDSTGAFSIRDFGSGQALVMSETVGDEEYSTYIYLWQGAVRELTIKSSDELSPRAGQEILKASSFEVASVGDDLLEFSVAGEEGSVQRFYVNLHSHGALSAESADASADAAQDGEESEGEL
ncbi:MAG: DUF4860 domain-containing protein [Eubacterium sp.]|nr:DUF4860 domain-containing protein [Eubacterium sp.]